MPEVKLPKVNAAFTATGPSFVPSFGVIDCKSYSSMRPTSASTGEDEAPVTTISVESRLVSRVLFLGSLGSRK